MIKKRLILALLTLPVNFALATCDLNDFRWDCDIPLHVRPQRYAHSEVYCGDAYGYISEREFDALAAYQRADVNMILTLNDEYADSPCLPSRRY